MYYEALLERINQISDLRKAARVLAWDRETIMPVRARDDRIQQITTIKRFVHELYVADETGELIEAADLELNGHGAGSAQEALIKFLKRDYIIARKLPGSFISRYTEISNQALDAWKHARNENDYNIFCPWLEKIIILARQKAELLDSEKPPYDVLLDRYEPGLKTSDVSDMFKGAENDVRLLLEEIRSSDQQVDDSFLFQPFDVGQQRTLANYLARAVGYDFSRGYLAEAVHPFSTNLSLNDVRITTRFNPNALGPSMFATLHEAGHAIYLQNIDQELNRTMLAKETSAGIDESQSRLIENMVGRSLGFWRVHFSEIQKIFHRQLAFVTVEEFYQAINKVRPGFIRVEADELTYTLHIILRFQLERALLAGTLSASDLPSAWNEGMMRLLNIEPRSDNEGCLQDIHWPMVGFGYFPTYALGNFYAAQLFEAAINQNADMQSSLEQGRFDSLYIWMRDNVHKFGRKLRPAQLIQMASGKPLDHRAFVTYARNKFSAIYGL